MGQCEFQPARSAFRTSIQDRGAWGRRFAGSLVPRSLQQQLAQPLEWPEESSEPLRNLSSTFHNFILLSFRPLRSGEATIEVVIHHSYSLHESVADR